MEEHKYDSLMLKNQLCFPLYAAAREIVKLYKPFLDKIGLTYTQYITMMVLWEHESLCVKDMGKYLHLDSGTLTPLLKKLEEKELVTRQRSRQDERDLIVTVTPKGIALRDEAVDVPVQMGKCIHLSPEEAAVLYSLLYKILAET